MKQNINKTLFFLGSTHFLIHVFSQILGATVPIIRLQYGLSLTEVSYLVSIPMLVQVLINLPVGYMADRRADLVLAASFIVTALGVVLVPIASGHSVLLAAFILIAVGSTLYHPPALKATTEIESDQKGLAIGIQNGGGSLGYAAGPLLFGFLYPVYGMRFSYYVWIPLILGAAVYSYRYLSNNRQKASNRPSLRDTSKMLSWSYLLVILAGTLTDAVFVILSTYITTYYTEVRGISPSLASIIFGVGPLLGILGSILGGSLGDRVSKKVGFLGIIAGLGVSIVLIPLTGNILLSSSFYVLWRALYSASMPLVNLMIADTTTTDYRSLGFSVYSISSQLIGAILPPLVSSLVLTSSIGYVFPTALGLLVPVVAIMLVLRD